MYARFLMCETYFLLDSFTGYRDGVRSRTLLAFGWYLYFAHCRPLVCMETGGACA